MHLTYRDTKSSIAPDITNVEITPEMIKRGVAFMKDHFLATLTSSAYQPEFVEALLRAAMASD